MQIMFIINKNKSRDYNPQIENNGWMDDDGTIFNLQLQQKAPNLQTKVSLFNFKIRKWWVLDFEERW